jgi:hypothetical protein
MAMKSVLGMMENVGGYMWFFFKGEHYAILLIIIHKYPLRCTKYQQYIKICI